MLKGSDYKRMDKAVVKKCRMLLRGAACQKDEEEDKVRYQAINNKAVFLDLQIVPSEVELYVQRIGWYQEILPNPEARRQILLGMVGDTRGLPAQVGLDGRTTEDANDYLKRLMQDLGGLGERDAEMQGWAERWGGYLGLLLGPRRDEDVYDEFVNYDTKALRAAWRHAAAEEVELDLEAGASEKESEGCTFECILLCEAGLPCGRRFASYAALAPHQRFSVGSVGAHGYRAYRILCVPGNVCLWCRCRSTFACRGTAVQHMARAVETGACRVDRGRFDYPLLVVSFQCPVCPFAAEVPAELVWPSRR